MSTENCNMSCSGGNKPHDIAVPRRIPGNRGVEIEIDALAAGGRGVGRAEGMVWFVSAALPGDRVLATATRRHARFVEGRLERTIVPSPDRRRPPCPVQRACGGCPWMALDERTQREWKRRLVVEALRRIGRSGVAVAGIRASTEVLGYRNKVELTLGRDAEGRPAVGFHRAEGAGAGLVDVPACAVQSDPANAVLGTARAFLMPRAEAWAGASDAPADPFRLVLRASRSTGRVLVALRETTVPFPDAHGLAECLARAHPELAGVVRIRALKGRRGGSRVLPVWGKTGIDERIGGLDFRLPAASFLQVNTEAAELLLELVRDGAGAVDGKAVLDIYAGVGVFGVHLAQQGADVIVCEADVEAVRCGRRAIRGRSFGRVRFEHADVGAFLRGEKRRADLVVANPPRSGLGRRVPELLGRLAPRRVVLVSCDPATLARDARRLVDAGFAAERAVPVDVFPQTAHVEAVMTFVRR
jgi:23S rRNA (uracil1939-C5)-methyltransferase